jgi:lysophospholipase L1-like esterase
MLNKIKIVLCAVFFFSASLSAQNSEPFISLITPNGGEYWTAGSYPRITWKSANVPFVKLEISYDAGNNWDTITSAAITENYFFSNWKVEDVESEKCLIRISKYDDPKIFSVSDTFFTIAKDSTINNIVVVGSSTAAGVGPSRIDSSWVIRYKNYLYERNTTINVINLAVSGFSTYDVMPSDFINPENRAAPKTEHNISKALEYNPKAIIINLPSNDASQNYSVGEQLANYNIICSVLDSLNIPVWVTTPQPRNFSEEQIKIQFEMRDSTFAKFKEKTIDFWTSIADSSGRIDEKYDSGDGIHVNDSAHAILFNRVVEANIIQPFVHKTDAAKIYQQNIPAGQNELSKENFLHGSSGRK